jgi:hypothetical protein
MYTTKPTAAEHYNFANVENDGKLFISELLKQCKLFDAGAASGEYLMKMGNKDVIAHYLASALQLLDRQHNLVIDQRVHISSYQKDIIKLQRDVIDAQGKALQVVDRISQNVEDSVQSGMKKSYSEAAVKFACTIPTSTAISPETLKSVAKQVVIEEELSRNIMIFGLPEEEKEDICARVGNVFELLGEKPKIVASRLGKKVKSDPRPVKVTLRNATTVQHLLAKSRQLRDSDKFKTVFLSPDRTAEQRAEHRELVQQLKDKVNEEPLRYHYIKGGQLYSTDPKKQTTTAPDSELE